MSNAQDCPADFKHVYQSIGSVESERLSESLVRVSKETIKEHNNRGLVKVFSMTLNRGSTSRGSIIQLCRIILPSQCAYW